MPGTKPAATPNLHRPNHSSRGGSRDGKGLLSDTNRQKDHNAPSVSKPKPTSSNGEKLLKDPKTNDLLDIEYVGPRAHQRFNISTSVSADKLIITLNRDFKEDKCIVPSQDDTVQNPLVLSSGKASADREMNPGASGELELSPRVAVGQPGDDSCPGQTIGFDNIEVDRKGASTEDQNCSVALGLKSFDPESCNAQTSLARDVNSDTNMCTDTEDADADGISLEQSLFEKKLNSSCYEAVKERSKTNIAESAATVDNEYATGYVNHSVSANPQSTMVEKFTTCESDRHHVNPELSARSLH
ncbi:hypothetical protein KIW84_035563 [Lathyrus oleraceus]|uniref:Uncharacterized protein n=1 Tax=Pisum sativum TaxID=3888 RepID=A0A9D4Y3X5_PEA|nr:hypothetical protein KIW84_035563 [Pisum sativum]